MASKLISVPTGTPRPFLSIVKALQLDLITLNKQKTLRGATSNRDASTPTIAANDSNILESGRNNTLTSMAGAMRRKGMSETAIAAALHAENVARCKPPLDPGEVDGIAASIMRYPASTASSEVLKTLTDTGNATRFGFRHAGQIVYVPGQGWMLWNGLQWQRDEIARVMELAKNVSRSIYQEGEALEDNEARIAVARHAKTSLQAPRLKAMLELAQSMPELVAQSGQMDSHDMLLGVGNGVVNLYSGRLQPARAEDHITRHSPVIFDSNATCPTFENFLEQVTDSDKSLMDYLQHVVGYCLTGNTTEQCLFFLHGSGANGKSTFLNTVKAILGPELARQTPSETLMARNNSGATNDIARLTGVRAVFASEVEDGSLMAETLVC